MLDLGLPILKEIRYLVEADLVIGSDRIFLQIFDNIGIMSSTIIPTIGFSWQLCLTENFLQLDHNVLHALYFLFRDQERNNGVPCLTLVYRGTCLLYYKV